MSEKITVKIARTNGVVDVAATVANLHNELAKISNKEQTLREVIREAVAQVWLLPENADKKCIQINTLAGLAMQFFKELETEAFGKALEMVKDYIRTNHDEFSVMKGKDNGCYLLSRCTDEEVAKFNDARERATAKAAAKKAA